MNHFVLEKKANEFRTSHGINNNDNIRLKSLLYKLNVLTVFKPLKEGFSGMAIKVNNNSDPKRFILINSSKSLGHQHFTICHELYHLFEQEDFTSMICTAGKFDKKQEVEYHADIFASYLVLPESGIKSMIPDDELSKDRISLKTILNIEQYFACSRAALLYRLKSLSIISSECYDKYSVNVKRGAIEYGHTITLYESGNDNQVFGDYGSIARELFEKNVISESHYYTLLLDLGMNIDQLENLDNEER